MKLNVAIGDFEFVRYRQQVAAEENIGEDEAEDELIAWMVENGWSIGLVGNTPADGNLFFPSGEAIVARTGEDVLRAFGIED